MTGIFRNSLLLAGASLLAGSNAYAAEAGPADRADKADQRIIIVSIKHPDQSNLDYPASVTSIDLGEIKDRQTQDLSSLSYVAPNVSLDPIGTFKGVANFSIRGLGINSSIPSIDPAVGLFVDGVYMGTNAGTVFDLLDVQNIELLRGPQGVAFGRNTTGGAVLVTTADPSWQWEGHGGLSVEGPVDSGRGAAMWTGRAVVSGPLTDKIAFRLGVLRSDDGGYFKNQFDGSNFGKSKTTVIRGGLTVEATDRLTVTAKGEYTESHGDGATTHNNGLFARDNFDLSVNDPGFYRSKNRFVVVRAEYELDIGVVTNIFGWRKYRLSTRNDIDSSPAAIFDSDTGTSQEQWSDELYYTADYGALAVTAGAYIFHQDIGYDETRDLVAFNLPIYYGGGTRRA